MVTPRRAALFIVESSCETRLSPSVENLVPPPGQTRRKLLEKSFISLPTCFSGQSKNLNQDYMMNDTMFSYFSRSSHCFCPPPAGLVMLCYAIYTCRCRPRPPPCVSGCTPSTSTPTSRRTWRPRGPASRRPRFVSLIAHVMSRPSPAKSANLCEHPNVASQHRQLHCLAKAPRSFATIPAAGPDPSVLTRLDFVPRLGAAFLEMFAVFLSSQQINLLPSLPLPVSRVLETTPVEFSDSRT